MMNDEEDIRDFIDPRWNSAPF